MFIIIDMGKKKTVIMPSVDRNLQQMGEQIRLARLRRKLSVELVAERAGVSRSSVWAVEKGSPSVAMGVYAMVLNAIGMSNELKKVCADDILGKTLQDLNLPLNKRNYNK